jgi:hypothetical protein
MGGEIPQVLQMQSGRLDDDGRPLTRLEAALVSGYEDAENGNNAAERIEDKILRSAYESGQQAYENGN